MTPLDELLQRFGVSRADLSGAALAGEIPATNAVVNRFIAAQLAERDLPVASVQVEAAEGDAFTAHVVPKVRFIPPVRIAVRIERQPEFPADPVLWLRWQIPGFGALAAFAAPVLSLFQRLPPGIRAEGDRIAIDVRELLVSRGLGELVDLIRALRVRTRPGAFVVGFDAGT